MTIGKSTDTVGAGREAWIKLLLIGGAIPVLEGGGDSSDDEDTWQWYL
jgi:hypothetical protein